MRQRVVEGVDLDREGRRRAVEDGAGREDARAEDQPGLLIFRRGENFAGVVRRVVERRHAVGERRGVEPVLLRDDPSVAHRPVPVRVDQAGDDGLAGDVDGGVPAGMVIAARGPTAVMRLPSISTVPSSITSSPRSW